MSKCVVACANALEHYNLHTNLQSEFNHYASYSLLLPSIYYSLFILYTTQMFLRLSRMSNSSVWVSSALIYVLLFDFWWKSRYGTVSEKICRLLYNTVTYESFSYRELKEESVTCFLWRFRIPSVPLICRSLYALSAITTILYHSHPPQTSWKT